MEADDSNGLPGWYSPTCLAFFVAHAVILAAIGTGDCDAATWVELFGFISKYHSTSGPDSDFAINHIRCAS
jgi:hypothetical protein